jgi:dipeptidyl-peptidase 4
MKLSAFLFLSFCISLGTNAQKIALTNKQYFEGNFSDYIQQAPSLVRWLNDADFLMNEGGDVYLVNGKTGVKRLATAEEKSPVVKEAATAQPYSRKNDLYIKVNNNEVRLTNDSLPEQNATLSPNKKYVAYTKAGNLYCVNIADAKETQLTFDGSKDVLNGYLSWVYMEEIIGRQSQYRGFWWSPNSDKIAFFRSDDTNVPTFTITDGMGQHGYTEVQHYPKVGDKNPEVKVGFANPNGGVTVWADFNEKNDQYYGQPNWTNDGTALWVNWMNRGNDSLNIFSVNPNTGAKTSVYTEKQKTWIDLDDNERITFLQDGKHFIMLSDRTGWKHIYLYSLQGKQISAITQGKYTVTGIDRIDEKAKLVYFTARSKENTARRDYYVADFSGKKVQRITFGEFNHSVDLSPNGGYAVTTYNNSTTPNAFAVVNTKTGKYFPLGSAKKPALDNLDYAKTELLRIKSEDGLYDLPLKITWPVGFEKSKKYPVLISIYGGPDAGTVWDTWNLSGRQQWYAKEGLIQVALDHRASGHFGKEGVNYMHRNLGYWEMKDYGTMVKWLIDNAAADPTRVCITGFSYGGYMSCYALAYSPNVFTHAMAGGSVTDWALYDTHYTEKLMDTPAENPEGYKTSSVLTQLANFKGKLLLVHGNIDDNVHLQNSIQLASKLQDLKKDFQYMTYSGGRHGWRGAKNDHFENLKTQFIYNNLLLKSVPKELLR